MLLVDDEEQIRRMLRRLLARRFPHVEVVEASSGEEAIALLDRERFTVVFTDYRMSGATGGDVLRHAQRVAPETGRVLSTGYSDESILKDAFDGVTLDAFLAKPWDHEKLLATLGSLLGGVGQNGSLHPDRATETGPRAGRPASSPPDHAEVMR